MANNSRRAQKIDLGNADWISLLSCCIESVSTDQFTDDLINALKSITNFDYSVGFAYHQNEQPVCLFHNFNPSEQLVFVDDYLKGPYLLDPFFIACGRKVNSGLYRLRDIAPDRFLQSEYHRSYYVRTGLAEEICFTLYLPDDIAVVISLMRSAQNQRFSAREFKLLERVVEIVCSLARQHWQSLSDGFDSKSEKSEAGHAVNRVEHKVRDIFGKRITPRETQVVAKVLEGYSSEAIAKSLGITTGTVRIHRRNVYAKLDISSQQELFSIFFRDISFPTAGSLPVI